MAIPGGLTRGLAKSQRKVAALNTSITGTGAITSGLLVIDVGSAQLTMQNAATTIPSDACAAVTSIVTGTVNVLVVTLQAAANIVSVAAKNVGLLCTGQ